VWATLLFAEAYSIMWSMITRDYLVAMVVIMGASSPFLPALLLPGCCPAAARLPN